MNINSEYNTDIFAINQSDQSIANSFLSRLANSKCRIKVISFFIFAKYCIYLQVSLKKTKILKFLPFGAPGRPKGALNQKFFGLDDFLT